MEFKAEVQTGDPNPLGATVQENGVNFSIFSKNAEYIELLIFAPDDPRKPARTIGLNPKIHKTFYYWHCFVPGLKEGALYAYRAYGKNDPQSGWKFDGGKVLVDPYARAVLSEDWDREKACVPGNNLRTAMKGVIVDPANYDWEGDRPLNLPYAQSVIYELHVGGFTRHPSSGLRDEWRGTYRGLVEKIPYLKELGITAVELLPVQQFDPFDSPSHLSNYWGYAPVNFFAPHNGYFTDPDPIKGLNEFRDMVKALHRAGIEVILDVVFNHTAEGGQGGPTFSFKGLENKAYYLLDNVDHTYKNYSGTGNTLNANHSIVRRMIRNCLEHWVDEMHIDGFRFDLASVLTRDEYGNPLENPPLLWEIESDPILAPTKIIAEAWDLESYQLGTFVGDRWAEWNGKFRDDIRRYIKGDAGMVWPLANRVAGSPDLFRVEGRNPNRSINFITCHDGFTMNDLVSYNEKHNEANLEGNRDGHNGNFSWNCGVEGPTDDPEVEQLRIRQIKNLLTLLLVSQGTPMLLMGDEVRRTQGGNNNAYCQDNEISWMDWDTVEKERELFTFAQKLIRFNLETPYFHERSFWTLNQSDLKTHIHLHGTRENHPDMDFESRSLAWTLKNPYYPFLLHFMSNAWHEPLDFELPRLDKARYAHWYRLLDTNLPAPDDLHLPSEAQELLRDRVRVAPRSIVAALSPKTGSI